MRTHSDSRYRPIRRCTSRYGKIEKALETIKSTTDEDETFTLETLISYTKMNRLPTSRILMFTNGIDHVSTGVYKFTGAVIRVENGGISNVC